ncbi:MAG: hypothetical protein AVDCRST_MAG13-893, partial [uncultured Solirubrobacteraceae bacterium]
GHGARVRGEADRRGRNRGGGEPRPGGDGRVGRAGRGRAAPPPVRHGLFGAPPRAPVQPARHGTGAGRQLGSAPAAARGAPRRRRAGTDLGGRLAPRHAGEGGQGDRARPRERDHELPPHRLARRAAAARTRRPARAGRAPRRRQARAAAAGGRSALRRAGLARHRRGGPHGGPCVPALPRKRPLLRPAPAGAAEGGRM